VSNFKFYLCYDECAMLSDMLSCDKSQMVIWVEQNENTDLAMSKALFEDSCTFMNFLKNVFKSKILLSE
jgi:hypothetical protein